MSRSAALLCALDLLRMPKRVAMMRARPLPDGVEELLSILSGDAEVIAAASRRFCYSPARLREAAEFFVSQVMFAPEADAYRLLGCPAAAEKGRLRAHLVLLLRWLHPDAAHKAPSPHVVSRVTAAWDSLKTEERRAAYDAARALRLRAAPPSVVDPGLGQGPSNAPSDEANRQMRAKQHRVRTGLPAQPFSRSPQPG